MTKKYAAPRNPPFEPTQSQRDNVRVAVACGMPQDLVCRQLVNPATGKPIDEKTLRLHFRAELDDGMSTANAMVARSLYLKAMGDGKASVSAAIFWLKCRAGWKEVSVVEQTGLNGGPIQHAGISVQLTTTDPLEAARQYQKLMG
jgi:hypothetical protein